MNPMLAALQKRKMGGDTQMGDHQMSHQSQHGDDKQKDLRGLVASLDEGEKHKLKAILNSDPGSDKIAQGAPSTEETGKIAENMTEENNETAMEEGQEGSDDIAKSMLDSRHLGSNPPTGKPRNLGERMKMSLASKLKGKGKI